ncbi:MAG: hypothetical protein BYD32DRAFT_433002 [Podila humilis]|nr:MAG: hypothetical protein BYD32DRAFT_433002 [Podila humilis]
MRPKETTPLLHDSDTIVNLPSADEQLILFCVFEGECAMSTFSVKASYADTVDDLKKLVKAAKTPNFDAMPADRLKLTAVSVPVEPATEAVAVKVQSLDYHRFLRPTELLCEVFEDTVPRNTIHIVVDMMPTDPVHLRSLARVIGMAVGVGALFAVLNILLSVYL